MQNPPINPEQIVTRMKFDTKSESPKLTFKATRWIDEEEHALVKQASESDDAKRAITMTVAKMDGVVAPPAPALPPREVKAKTKPEDLVADSEEEPVVRKEEKKPSAVPAKKSSLAAMVDDWDDEA